MCGYLLQHVYEHPTNYSPSFVSTQENLGLRGGATRGYSRSVDDANILKNNEIHLSNRAALEFLKNSPDVVISEPRVYPINRKKQSLYPGSVIRNVPVLGIMHRRSVALLGRTRLRLALRCHITCGVIYYQQSPGRGYLLLLLDMQRLKYFRANFACTKHLQVSGARRASRTRRFHILFIF